MPSSPCLRRRAAMSSCNLLSMKRGRRFGVLIAVAAMLAVPGSGSAADRVERGRLLLTEHCSGCHAVGTREQSPVRAAPSFRTIGNRLSMDELFDRLQEGLSSAHRNMPTFRFTREDAHAVRSYLNSIQN